MTLNRCGQTLVNALNWSPEVLDNDLFPGNRQNDKVVTCWQVGDHGSGLPLAMKYLAHFYGKDCRAQICTRWNLVWSAGRDRRLIRELAGFNLAEAEV
jgi:hypothetical protein